MSKKLGIALSGGGAWSIGGIGVLKALEENGIKVDYIAGCSVGALFGAAYASQFAGPKTLDATLEAIKKIKFHHGIHFNRHASFGLFSPKRIGEQFEKQVGKYNIEDLPIKFAAIATDFRTGEQVVFDKGPLTPALTASTSFTLVFAPFEYQGKLLTDGGVSSPTPVDVVRRMGADIVIGVDSTSDKHLTRVDEKLHQKHSITKYIPLLHFVRSRHIGATFSQLIDLIFSNLNKEYLKNNPPDVLLSPKVFHIDQFSFNRASEMIREGEKVTLEVLPKIRKLLE